MSVLWSRSFWRRMRTNKAAAAIMAMHILLQCAVLKRMIKQRSLRQRPEKEGLLPQGFVLQERNILSGGRAPSPVLKKSLSQTRPERDLPGIDL